MRLSKNNCYRLLAVFICAGLVTGCSNEGPPRESVPESTIPEALLLSSSTLTGGSLALYVSDSIAYVLTFGVDGVDDPNRLILFDISNTGFPVYLSEVNGFDAGFRIIPFGQFEPAGTALPALTSTLFVPAFNNGLHSFDVSDALKPELIETSPKTTGSIIDIALTETFRCIAETVDLGVLSTPPGGPVTSGVFPSTEAVIAVDHDENFCYMIELSATGTNPPQFRIIDPSVPGAPTQVGSVDLEGIQIIVADNMAYVITRDVGMSIVDFSNPLSPIVISQLDIPDLSNTLDPLSIDNTTKRAYIATEFGVSIIDISDPFFPVNIGDFELFDTPTAIANRNGILYVATFDDSDFNPPQLLIIDVSQF